MKRPAELVGLSGSVALIVGRVAGIEDPDLLVAVGAVAAALPAVVTLVVANGGIVGAARRLWRGKPPA